MKEKTLEKFFVWTVAICGFLLVFLSPPLTVPDENTHFINAYCISHGDFFAEVDPVTGGVGKYLPKYIADFTEKYRDNYAGQLDAGYSFGENYMDSWLPVNEADREMVFWQSNLVTINPWSYAISGFGMGVTSIICKLTGDGYDNAYNLMIAGRLANLLFYIIVGYLAVSITPCLKKTIMLLLSMPISLFLGASLSYDAILIPISMLLFAELMRLFMSADEDRVGIKDIVIVAVCTLFLTAVKMAYMPFLALLVLIPYKKFQSRNQYIKAIAIVCGMAVVGLILPKVFAALAISGVKQIPDPNIVLQKEYFFKHIYLFPVIVAKSFVTYRGYYTSSFVATLGHLDTKFPSVYISGFLIVLVLITLYECCNIKKIGWKIRVGALIMVCIAIIGMFAAMYLDWTPLVEEPCGDLVSGIQGRYFIPVFCFACMPIFNYVWKKVPKTVNDKVKSGIENITVFFVAMNGLLTLLVLLWRYWC